MIDSAAMATEFNYIYNDEASIGTNDRSLDDSAVLNFIASPSCNSTDKPLSDAHQGRVSPLLQTIDDEVDMKLLKKELWWSMISNLFFISGSMVYIILALWDHISFLFAYSSLVGDIFEWAGPTIYLINSAIDVGWANFLQQQTSNERKNLRDQQSVLASKKKGRRFMTMRNVNKIRKHAAHRRGLLAAISFGIAALLALIDLAYYYYGNYEKTMIVGSDRGIVDALSVHMYLVSALLAVTGRRTRPRTWTFTLRHPDNLEDLGDLFFLIGSLVDVVLCDYHFDDHTAFWSILSSFLWFFDACFYLRSDLLTKSVYDEVSLLSASGHLSVSSSGSSSKTKNVLFNRFAKMSGDQEADERLASIICKDNESMV
jgi:hypothetical protein